MFENAYLIHRYTRADALRDGVLFDVSATAREAGYRNPCTLTQRPRIIAKTKLHLSQGLW